MTDIRVPIDVEDGSDGDEPATMKPGGPPVGPRSRGTGVTAAPWTSDPPRPSEADEDPSVSIEPRTIKKASVPPPAKGASPASDEPASITLEPQMSVRGIDPAAIERMKNALADSGEGGPVTTERTEAASTDPAPVLTFPKKVPKMTLIGVGERGPALPAEDDPETITLTPGAVAVRAKTDTEAENEETERRPAASLETPITLTEAIPISRPQRDTEMTEKDDLTTEDAIPAPKTAPMTPGVAKTLQSPPALAFATTEKAQSSPSKAPAATPSKPPAIPSKPPAAASKPPAAAAPAPPRPAPKKPSAPIEARAAEPDPTPSARVRKETVPMVERPAAPAPRSPLESEDSSPHPYRGAFAAPSDDTKMAPHVKRTAYTLAASFVLAGALASAFVVWQAGSRTKRAIAATVHSASSPVPDEPPPTESAPPAAEPPEPASATAPKPQPQPSTTATQVRKQPPSPAPKPRATPPPRATARPAAPSPPPATTKPKPASTAFDPGAI